MTTHTGKELDPDFVDFNSVNRRYHFPFRFYLPFRGGFGQTDRAWLFRHSVARYFYVSSRPSALVDPWGLQEERFPGAAGTVGYEAKRAKEQQELSNLIGRLQGLCDDDTCLSCKCSHDRCYAEAEQIANTYFKAWKANVGCTTFFQARYGHLCYTWRNILWDPLRSLSLVCFRIAASADVRWNAAKRSYDIEHNFVTVTAGETAAVRGVCTLTLDPWLEGWPRAYTDKEHDYRLQGGEGQIPHTYLGSPGERGGSVVGGIIGPVIPDPETGSYPVPTSGFEMPDNPVPQPPLPPPSEKYKNWPPGRKDDPPWRK